MKPGEGALRFTKVEGKTKLHTVLASSPLRLLTPRNHGDAAWVFIASFGGGLVDGDEVRLRIDVDDGARAFLATQASTKVYRSRDGSRCGSLQTIDVDVARGGFFAHVPDPVACFEGAHYRQLSRITLAEGATLIWVDAYTCGRSARGERWAFARFASSTRVATSDGAPLLVDGVLLDPEHGELAARAGRFDAFATIIVTGPRARAIRETILRAPPPLTSRASLLQSASPLGESGAIARVAATTVEAATSHVRALLAPLATELGDDPFARKW